MKGFAYAYIEILKWDLKNMAFFKNKNKNF